MKGIKRMETEKEMEYFFIRMDFAMKVNLEMVYVMGLVFLKSIISISIMEIGLMIKFKDLAKLEIVPLLTNAKLLIQTREL